MRKILLLAMFALMALVVLAEEDNRIPVTNDVNRNLYPMEAALSRAAEERKLKFKLNILRILCLPCKLLAKLAKLATTSFIGKGVSEAGCSFILPGYAKHACGPAIEIGSFFLNRVPIIAICSKAKMCKAPVSKTILAGSEMDPIFRNALDILENDDFNKTELLVPADVKENIHHFIRDVTADLASEEGGRAVQDVNDFLDITAEKFVRAVQYLLENKDKIQQH